MSINKYYAFTEKFVHVVLNLSFIFIVSFHVAPDLFAPTQVHHRSIALGSPKLAPPYHSEQLGCNKSCCASLLTPTDNGDMCTYVTRAVPCQPEGFINYLQLFYCTCGEYPVFGFVILMIWLALLFYLLGNTAAEYFCTSLDGLSSSFRLSPAMAGATLLSLGNGAPDVFSSVVSFLGTSIGDDVGFNSILGGAFFVSSVVTGITSICVGSKSISIDKPSFIRDACFLLVALSALVLVIFIGRINIFGATAFTSLYFMYVLFTSARHSCWLDRNEGDLPGNEALASRSSNGNIEKNSDAGAPLLSVVETSEAMMSEQEVFTPQGNCTARRRVGTTFVGAHPSSSVTYYLNEVASFLSLPLYLTRRLTIPDVSEGRWSKTFAVASASLAPLLLAMLWESRSAHYVMMRPSYMGSWGAYVGGGATGLVFGLATFLTTDKECPPKEFPLPWLAAGFIMSVAWTYITAGELVSLMVSLGVILGIRPSLLAVTLLAWGNSIGDLIANVTMAMSGGPDGAQVAMSGCYAGPIFNILVSLGASLTACSWRVHPHSYVISEDPASLFGTIGFLAGGLLWAIAILSISGMRLGHVLGVGLLAAYSCFLFLTVAKALGFIS